MRPCAAGGRLRLRPLEPDDAGHILRLMGQDREAVECTAAMPWPLIYEDSRAWIAARKDKASNAFAILRCEDGGFLGSAGFSLGVDKGEEDAAEIGYWIGRSYWNQGYATESVQLLLELAKRAKATLAVGIVFTFNPASARVLEKNGFTLMGEEEHHYPVRGGRRRVWRYERVL